MENDEEKKGKQADYVNNDGADAGHAGDEIHKEAEPQTDKEDGSDVFKSEPEPKKDINKLDSSMKKFHSKRNNSNANEKKSRPFIKALIYTLSIIIASIIFAGLILFSVTDYLGLFRADKSADVKIPNNATADQIGDILKKNGIIRSSLVFKIYVKISNKHGMRGGEFSLDSSMSYDTIIRKLKTGASRVTVKVTIPEGYTLRQIGERLEKNKVCTKQDFLTAVQKSDIKFDFSSQIPKNSDRFYNLEGYLFPDTYEFYVGQAPDTVVKKMLTDFDTRIDKDLRKEIDSSGMTVDQVITLASIIQTESGGSNQMAKISSVFHNRLKNGVYGKKLLQSDATVFYATRDIKSVLSQDSTNIASAYNTYKHEGLPPGPICNPGIDAIKAALSPESTNYYYFVSDKNGNYYYAEDYATHVKNVKKALNTGKAGGTNVTDNLKK